MVLAAACGAREAIAMQAPASAHVAPASDTGSSDEDAVSSHDPGAENETGPILRLEDVLREASARNPEIAAARARARAAESIPAQVSAYDDPTLSWEAWDVPESLRVDEAENNIFRLSQKVPFPGKRSLAGEMAARDADVAASEAEAVALDVATRVKVAYYDLWQAHENARLYERERTILERFTRSAESRYALGEVPQPDVLRAQLELSHALTRARTARLAVQRAEVDLNTLLSRDPRTPLGVPMTVPHPAIHIDVEDLVDRALAQRPELRSQKAAIAREGSGVALAEKGFYPDFEISVGRFVNYGRSDGFGAMATVTLPFVQRSKYEAGVSEANAKLSAARAEARRLADRVRREVEDLALRAQAAVLEHDLLRSTHIPQAEQALRVTEAAYLAGNVDVFAVLDTVRAIESSHLEHVAAQVEFEKTWAELERAVGGELPRSSPAAPGATHGDVRGRRSAE